MFCPIGVHTSTACVPGTRDYGLFVLLSVYVICCALCRCALCVVRCAHGLCVVRCALCVVRCALCVVLFLRFRALAQ